MPTSGPDKRAAMAQRRFPPPWKAEEHDTCFIVKDHTGLNLAYVYFETEPNCRSASKLLSRGEARRIAAKFAKLPESAGE
jgi:endo-1,4-beta-D-glucanase Y